MLSKKTALIISLSLLLVIILIMVGTVFVLNRREGISVFVDRRVSKDLIFSGKDSRSPVVMPGDTVNINTADTGDLARLSGIGEVLAQRIVDYRDAHGSFARSEDIMNVPGITENIYEKNKEFIRTED